MAITHVDRSGVRSVAQLPSLPGFRFCPEVDELVWYYLTRKQDSETFQISRIAELDIYNFEPWDLPERALCGQEEWYFVPPRNQKYPTCLRSRRATASGYWHPKGKDKPIFVSRGSPRGDDEVGVKKTLEFYRGRVPQGEKTTWMMHEYHLPEGAHHVRLGSLRVENWVLCRIFKNPTRAQRAGHDHDMESIAPLLPKTDDPGFRNWLRGADSAAQQEALKLADSTCEYDRSSTTLPAMQMSQSRGGTSILELQTSATLQELAALSSLAGAWSPFQSCRSLEPFRALQALGALSSLAGAWSPFQSCRSLEPFPALHELGALSSMPSIPSRFTTITPISEAMVGPVMFQISEAMVHMHSQKIVHRDLKVHASKLCLEGFVIAKLADFGVSKMKREVTAYSHMTPNKGTRPWMAPERLGAKEEPLLVAYPFKEDVYSFSMVCYETLTTPLMDSLQSSRPEPENCPESLKSLIRMCWHTDPRRRLTFAEVAAVMEIQDASKAATAKPCVDESSDWVRNKIRKQQGVELRRKLIRFLDAGMVKSGCSRRELLEATKNLLDAQITPKLPLRGAISAYSDLVPLSSIAGLRTARPNLTEDVKTTTALEALRMVGIAKPLEPHEFEPARKRIRTRDWSAEEIRTMLETVDEALRMDVGPDIWSFVSDTLWENYGFDRSSNSCENLWGTLLQSHKASRDHGDTRASTGFELEFGETIERILPRLPLEGSRNFQMDLGLGLSPSALPLRQFQSSASETGFSDSADCEEAPSDAEMDEVETHCDDEVLSGDSTATIESQAEVSHVSRATEPWDETNSNHGREKSAARVLEEDLISRIAPFVNRNIEDALKPLLSDLRRQEEEQQKHREKLLALEQEKLALKREKMHFTSRVS